MRDVNFDIENPQYNIKAVQEDIAKVISKHKLDAYIGLPARCIAGFCVDTIQSLSSAFEYKKAYKEGRLQ